MKTGKKIFALFLAILMIVNMIPFTVIAANDSYRDVSSTHWAHDVISKWSGDRYSVLEGDGSGNFNPDKGLSLGELATILSKTFGYTERKPSKVTPDWADLYVERAMAAGILDDADEIDASVPVTREQAIKYIALAYHIDPVEGETDFFDNREIDEAYKPYIHAFQRRNYIAGKPGNLFDPKAVYTRSEAMQIIENTTSEIINESVSGQNYAKSIILRKSGITVKDTSVKENLIVGQGVGNGEITLDHVTIGDSLIVYGGGSNSIYVTGEKAIPSTIVNKPFGEPVHLNGNFGTVTVADGTNVILTGKVDQLILLGNAEVTLKDAKIDIVEIRGDHVKLIVNKGSRVENVTVSANNSILSGNGIVKNVHVIEGAKSGVEVLTAPTKIVVDANAGAVKTKDNGMVQPGETLTTSFSSTSSDRSSGGGGGSNGGSTPEPPNPPVDGDDFQLYSVTGILLDGNNEIMVETTASGKAILDVQILSDVTGINTNWESGNLLAKGRTTIEEAVEKEWVGVSVSSSLPDYFVVTATLLNDRGDKLCEPYVFLEHTKAYEQYENKTTADFDPERVVNLDNNETNNFLVTAEGIPYIQAGENGMNFLNASRSEEGIYVFTNADEMISGLQTGDRFIVLDQNAMIYPIEVLSISSQGTTVTIHGNQEPAIGEFVEFIKINMENVELGEPEMDLSDADEGVVLLDKEDTDYDVVIDHFDDAPSLDDIISDPNGSTTASVMQAKMTESPYADMDGSASGTINLGIKHENEEKTFEINGKVEAKGTVSVKIVFDIKLFGSYLDCTTSVKLETEAQFKVIRKKESDAIASLELKLGTAHFPTPIAGMTVKAEVFLPVQCETSAGFIATAKAEVEAGVRFGTVGFQPFLEKSMSADFKTEGKLTVTIGPKIQVGLSFINCLDAKTTMQAGLEIEGTLTISHPDFTITTDDSIHACMACVDGTVDFFVKNGIEFKMTLFDIKALTWKKEYTFAEWRLHLAKFFVSILNAADSIYGGKMKFGWNAECENHLYRTVIDPKNEGNTVDSAKVTISKEGGDVVVSGTGKITKMLYPGRYVASAAADHFNFTDKKFTVSDKAQTVLISTSGGDPQPGQGILNGDVMDAETRRLIPSASIKVYSGSTLVESKATDDSGSYEMALDAGSYRIDISAPNYILFTVYITVEDGRTHYVESLLLVESGEGSGIASGVITDAVNGQSLSGVKLTVTNGWGNQNGTPITTSSTDRNGRYQFALPYGNYTVIMSLDGYVTDSFHIVIKRSPFERQATLSPVQGSGEYRVVLTWGISPRDLDSHLNANENVHIYFHNMRSSYAWLDVDDVFSYGPETITISDLSLLGGFKFSVHDYTNRVSGTTQLSSSNAVVQLYQGNTLLRTYHVPTGKSGTVWNVFRIGADGRITDLNDFEYQDSPSLVGRETTERSFTAEPEPLKDYELETIEMENEAEPSSEDIPEDISEEPSEDIPEEPSEDIPEESSEKPSSEENDILIDKDNPIESENDTTEKTIVSDQDDTNSDHTDTSIENTDTSIEKKRSDGDSSQEAADPSESEDTDFFAAI